MSANAGYALAMLTYCQELERSAATSLQQLINAFSATYCTYFPNTVPILQNKLKLSLGSKQEECPSGQVAYKDPSGNETSACAANHVDSCPGGYFCQWSQGAGKFLCCGVSAGL
jgi:hypothetical protein